MTCLSAMQDAAVRLISRRPSTFFSSQDTFEVEIVNLVNEVAKDIMKSHGWQALIRVAEFQGDGTNTAFAKPDDYDRMTLDSDIQDPVNWVWGYRHVKNINDFLYYKNRGFWLTPGMWILYGNEFQFYPAPTGEAEFPYVSKNFALDSDGTAKAEFTEDNDTFILDERLLTLGLIYKWREMKELDHGPAYDAFVKAISEEAARDAGSSIIRDRRPRWPGQRFSIAYPWPLGG